MTGDIIFDDDYDTDEDAMDQTLAMDLSDYMALGAAIERKKTERLQTKVVEQPVSTPEPAFDPVFDPVSPTDLRGFPLQQIDMKSMMSTQQRIRTAPQAKQKPSVVVPPDLSPVQTAHTEQPRVREILPPMEVLAQAPPLDKVMKGRTRTPAKKRKWFGVHGLYLLFISMILASFGWFFLDVYLPASGKAFIFGVFSL